MFGLLSQILYQFGIGFCCQSMYFENLHFKLFIHLYYKFLETLIHLGLFLNGCISRIVLKHNSNITLVTVRRNWFSYHTMCFKHNQTQFECYTHICAIYLILSQSGFGINNNGLQLLIGIIPTFPFPFLTHLGYTSPEPWCTKFTNIIN